MAAVYQLLYKIVGKSLGVGIITAFYNTGHTAVTFTAFIGQQPRGFASQPYCFKMLVSLVNKMNRIPGRPRNPRRFRERRKESP